MPHRVISLIAASVVFSIATAVLVPRLFMSSAVYNLELWLTLQIVGHFIAQLFLYFIWDLIYAGTGFRMIFRSVRGLVLGTLLNYILLWLFGAPLFTNATRTLLLSALVASLGAVAVSCSTSMHTSDISAVLSAKTLMGKRMPSLSLTPSIYPAMGAMIGCWAGAAPLPLDWDVWWQEYPFSLAAGAIIGYNLGRIYQAYRIRYPSESLGLGENSYKTE